MTRFQLIFTGFLVFCAVVGAVLFAVVRSNNSSSTAPLVTLWGTLPAQEIQSFISDVTLQNRSQVNVRYTQKDAATFESGLIEALARGEGPDMILLPQDLIVKQLDKFYIIPYETYSERAFKDSFIEGAEIYLSPNGVVALPFTVDPLVMYWNRDIFSNAGVSLPPSAWTEFHTLAPKMVRKDAAGNITQSLVAFGSFNNVGHAKDAIALLTLQAGGQIVSRSDIGFLQSTFSAQGRGLVPGEQAVNFFTEFSNPVKQSYSWNGALQQDKSAFIAGKLALYFGYASELASIRAANPNLNFDVAVVPQADGKRVTFGRMNGIALLKSSPNIAAAYVAAHTMTNEASQALWVAESGKPPIRRSLLAALPADAAKSIFYESALVSRAWLDPDPASTAQIFSRLVQNVTSGRMRTSEAVKTASLEMNNLLRR